MIVKCVGREYATLPETYINPKLGFGRDAVIKALEIGKEYVVYAISSSEDRVHFWVYEDEEIPYPYAEPAPFFEIVDPSASPSWRVGFNRELNRLEIAFAEWFADPFFLDKLTDWEEAEVSIFRDVKSRMDTEAEELRKRA